MVYTPSIFLDVWGTTRGYVIKDEWKVLLANLDHIKRIFSE
jgi:hypothetical protein